jgi:hypothetical protein
MIATKDQFLFDEDGNRTSVLLSNQRYEMLLQALEELEAVQAFDAAQASDEEAIPFDQAVREIEAGR